jgi:hypothetical protein
MAMFAWEQEKRGPRPRIRPPYLVEWGWQRSRELRRPVDAEGNPLPWYTYPMIYFLRQRVQPHWRVFEYGSGNSTLWWAKRVASVVSCEHDRGWFEQISKTAPPNVTYVYQELNEHYPDAILAHEGPFEVVVIDGRERAECAKRALKRLSPDGVIIWDNAEFPRCRQFFSEHCQPAGFRMLDFHGTGPQKETGWLTALIYRANNVTGL